MSINPTQPEAARADLARDKANLIHSLHNRAAQRPAHIWTRGLGAQNFGTNLAKYISMPWQVYGTSWSDTADVN